jgi:hypothetical protein
VTPGNQLFAGERIFRYEVPVDDQWHDFKLWGDPLAVQCRDIRAVEFWARHGGENADPSGLSRSFIVVGTGHPIPTDARYWGTAIAPGGQLVWHLLELWP